MASNPHHDVTAKILDDLKAALATSSKPIWVQPWASSNLNIPRNACTGRKYSGVNVILLWLATHAAGWKAPQFVTFKQALELGGHVRKGEHGTKIVFTKELTFAEDGGGDEEAVRHVRLLKTYTVFNVAQCEGLPARVTEVPPPPVRHHDKRDPEIDEFVTITGAKVEEAGGRACFIPTLDLIRMPAFTSFSGAAIYYATLFHELAHWTGDKRRLARFEFLQERFGACERAAEEWVAELASALLCCEFAINGDLRHAEYLASWIELIEHDERPFFTVASKAQAAVDYLRELALREKEAA